MRRLLYILMLVSSAVSLNAQQSISGIIYEEVNGIKTPLPFASIFVPGSSRGTITSFEGEYALAIFDTDTLIKVSYIGFADVIKRITPVGSDVVMDVVMSPSEETNLEQVVITARKNTNSEKLLLLEQKQSAVNVEYVGSESMALQGISDAAGAVTKLSGISKQEGSQQINVRGLGDRYNTTTLNGLPLPSNNPELKNIDLALFESDVISNVEIEKSYTADLYGDFGGANININSKRLVDAPFIKIGIEGSMNSNMLIPDAVLLPDVGNKTGFYSSPAPAVAPILAGTAYNFENSWNPNESNPLLNGKIGIAAGQTFKLKNSTLNAMASLSFGNSYNYSERIERVVNASNVALTDLKGEEFAYSTQTTGMVNLELIKEKSKYSLNTLLLNTSDQELTTLVGTIRDVSADSDGLKRRGQFQSNLLIVNQLLGKNELSEQNTLDWGLSYNYLTNDVPDRQQNTYESYDKTTNIGAFDPLASGRNYRYYQAFDENEFATNINFHRAFGKKTDDNIYRGKWSLGYSGRYKFRDFHSLQFNHQVWRDDENQNILVDIDDVQSYLNQENYLAGDFGVRTIQVDGENGFRYDGQSIVNSGFGLVEYQLNTKLLVLAGLRFESVYQYINYLSSQNVSGEEESTTLNEKSILPSLSLKYSVTQKTNLRFALSKTYTLPRLEEMPLLVFEGISDATYGNPYIYSSKVYNADLKWERYPKNGEMLSAALFGKYIVDPINKFAVNTSFNEFTNANTGDWGYLYGIELDVKKTIADFSRQNSVRKLSISGNLTLMQTQQELNSEKVSSETHQLFYSNFTSDRDALQGAAPLICNVALGYSHKWNEQQNNANLSVVYNYISDRIYALGHTSMGNQVDKAFNTLDIVAKTKINNVEISLKALNILNPSVERIQKNATSDELIQAYKRGTQFSLSVTYKI